ncbi:hypothetical protein L1276_002945 [Flavobacterium sp. HSC-32F16]|nr:hypothetical protein [Flavobacterium sp. HSC-32F16]
MEIRNAAGIFKESFWEVFKQKKEDIEVPL